MGAVYEAKDQRLGNRVALKQIIVSNAQLQRAFEREARILAQLRHPALPVVIDYFSESNKQFLVMEYIPGDDLQNLLLMRHSFPVTQVRKWADELLDALEYLHSQNPPIIHRDIKPANIKLSPRGEVILLDFGISKGGKTSTTHLTMSATSIQAYSPHYAPLEQIEGKGTDERSDLYSLGVTLHHLLTGTIPPTAITRASAQIHNTPDPLRTANQLNPQVPAAVSDVLRQATTLNRTQRPANAKVMREALRRAVQAPVVRPQPLAAQKRSSAPPRNKKLDKPFDKGLKFYREGKWGFAKRELSKVVKKQPDYQRDGQRASDLLAEVEQKIANLTIGEVVMNNHIIRDIIGMLLIGLFMGLFESVQVGVTTGIAGAVAGAVFGPFLRANQVGMIDRETIGGPIIFWGALVAGLGTVVGGWGGAIGGAIIGAIGGAIGGAIIGAIVVAIVWPIDKVMGWIWETITGREGSSLLGPRVDLERLQKFLKLLKSGRSALLSLVC